MKNVLELKIYEDHSWLEALLACEQNDLEVKSNFGQQFLVVWQYGTHLNPGKVFVT